MRAHDRGNAVHLHEAEIVDELVEPFAVERAVGMGGEALPGEEDAAGGEVGNGCGHEVFRHMFMICSRAWIDFLQRGPLVNIQLGSHRFLDIYEKNL